MLLFCPLCATMLMVEEGHACYRFSCNTCPYVHNVNRKMGSRIYPKLKPVDDVMGAADTWKNVQQTTATCPKCFNNRAYFVQIQTRSADEPMTTFYKCTWVTCGNMWKE